MPNTLDTTVFASTYDQKPDTYIITGDIDAQWLRNSSAQVWPYLPCAASDKPLRRMIEGVIRRQGRLVLRDPYANSFTRETTDPALRWSLKDRTEMKPGVAERKWEVDSLCYVLRLAHGFLKATDDFSRGKAAEGIGGPHIGRDSIWPMSILMRGLTSVEDAEIKLCLRMLRDTTGGTGFMHESFNKDDAKVFTRGWFAWANTLFGEVVLKVVAERPYLLSGVL